MTEQSNFHIELAYAIIERDIAQYRKELLDKLILKLQSQINIITEEPTEPKPNPTVKEITFNILIYEQQQGSKLGIFEVATKPTKDNATWQYAYNILKVNNATIDKRFHDEGYQHSYWLYSEGKIYRQKLKES